MHKLLLVSLVALVAAPGHAKVGVRSTHIGSVLADARGHTLYVYDRATCTGSCAATWPPFLTKGKPAAGRGVAAAKLGTKKLPGGKLQVTFAGKPLYFYAGDSAAGQVAGAAVPHWAALSPAGAKLVASTTTTPSTTTPAPPIYGGGGDGYGSYGP